MTEEQDWEAQEAEAEWFSELKAGLADALSDLDGVVAFPNELERDVIVHGRLSVLLEFFQNYRSEIEELG